MPDSVAVRLPFDPAELEALITAVRRVRVRYEDEWLVDWNHERSEDWEAPRRRTETLDPRPWL